MFNSNPYVLTCFGCIFILSLLYIIIVSYPLTPVHVHKVTNVIINNINIDAVSDDEIEFDDYNANIGNPNVDDLSKHNDYSASSASCSNPNLLSNMIKVDSSILTTINASNLKFVHIPKTGGSTLELVSQRVGYQWGRLNTNLMNILKDYQIRDTVINCPNWHIPPYIAKYSIIAKNKADDDERININISEYYNSIDTFCVVRNPYTRIISEWNYRKCPGDINTFIKEWTKKFYNTLYYKGCHWLPQYKFIYEIWDMNEFQILNLSNDIKHEILKQRMIDNDDNHNENDPGDNDGDDNYVDLMQNVPLTCKYILKQENLNQEFKMLVENTDSRLSKMFDNSKKIFADNSKMKQSIERCKHDQAKTGGVFITNTSIQLIKNLYKKDFKLFCYDIDHLPDIIQVI